MTVVQTEILDKIEEINVELVGFDQRNMLENAVNKFWVGAS